MKTNVRLPISSVSLADFSLTNGEDVPAGDFTLLFDAALERFPRRIIQSDYALYLLEYVSTSFGRSILTTSTPTDLIQVTELDTILATKDEVALKASQADLEALDLAKASVEYVDDALELKADVEYVDDELGGKLGPSDVGNAAFRDVGVSTDHLPLAQDTVRPNATNLEAEVIEVSHLSQEVRDQFSGGQTFQLSDRLGQVESLGFNFPDPTTNGGKWYDCVVSGTPSGTNAPSDDLAVGQRIFSDATDWVITPPSVTNIPNGVVTRPKLSIDVRRDVDFVRDALRSFISNLNEDDTIYHNNDVVSGDVEPVVTGRTGNIVAGVRRSTGRFVAALSQDDKYVGGSVGHWLTAANAFNYTGFDPIYPIVTDYTGDIKLGYDTIQNKLVGNLESQSSGGGSAASIPEGQPGGPLAPANQVVRNKRVQVLFYGQSLSNGVATGSVLTTTQVFFNRTFDVGPKATPIGGPGINPGMTTDKLLVEDALTGDDGSDRRETPCSGFAEMASLTLLAKEGVQPADCIFFVSTAGHSGYRASLLTPDAAWFAVAAAHVVRAKAVAGADSISLTAIAYLQGEADVDLNTPPATWKILTESIRAALQAQAVSAMAQSHPVHMLLYQVGDRIKLKPQIALAQLELCRDNPLIHHVTALYHLPRSGDNVHFTAVGAKWVGAYYARAHAAILAGRRPNWIQPLGAVRRGLQVTVFFKTPFPLILDRSTLAVTADDGFVVKDANGAVPILSINVVGVDQVRITLNATPSGTTTVRYALDNLGAGLTVRDSASGNLRDTCPDTFTFLDQVFPLFNVCPHFEVPLYNIV